MRLAEVSLVPRPPSPKLSGTGRVSLPVKTGRQNIDHKRNCLWILSWQKGVPRKLMNGLPTGRLEKLVNWWPEQKPITPMSHDAVADKPGKHSFLPGQPVLIDSANLRPVSLTLTNILGRLRTPRKKEYKINTCSFFNHINKAQKMASWCLVLFYRRSPWDLD